MVNKKDTDIVQKLLAHMGPWHFIEQIIIQETNQTNFKKKKEKKRERIFATA